MSKKSHREFEVLITSTNNYESIAKPLEWFVRLFPGWVVQNANEPKNQTDIDAMLEQEWGPRQMGEADTNVDRTSHKGELSG